MKWGRDVKVAMVEEILDFLNQKKIRATYGAVSGLIDDNSQNISRYLKEKSPRYSWIVSSDSKMPSGYSKGERHKDLETDTNVLMDSEELRFQLLEWQKKKRR